MLRVRFHANRDDPRPVNWPVKHPYWVTGYGGDMSVIVSYADNLAYIYENWPEADIKGWSEADKYLFNSRFEKPEWFDG